MQRGYDVGRQCAEHRQGPVGHRWDAQLERAAIGKHDRRVEFARRRGGGRDAHRPGPACGNAEARVRGALAGEAQVGRPGRRTRRFQSREQVAAETGGRHRRTDEADDERRCAAAHSGVERPGDAVVGAEGDLRRDAGVGGEREHHHGTLLPEDGPARRVGQRHRDRERRDVRRREERGAGRGVHVGREAPKHTVIETRAAGCSHEACGGRPLEDDGRGRRRPDAPDCWDRGEAVLAFQARPREGAPRHAAGDELA
mmetsp:Transcript_37192/g.114868  ORF Transcript_37192/g.114868 Transcript_37192/m.114868 type:complete len:256 (-) Transcript_37192:42-809(-)